MQSVGRKKPSVEGTRNAGEEARPKLIAHFFPEIFLVLRQWPENGVEIIAGKVIQVDSIFRRLVSHPSTCVVERFDELGGFHERVWAGGTTQVCYVYCFWAKSGIQICYGFFCYLLCHNYGLLLLKSRKQIYQWIELDMAPAIAVWRNFQSLGADSVTSFT